MWQVTHGGLRTIQDVLDHLEEHDRMMGDNHFYPAAGVSYSFPRFDVFGSYLRLGRGRVTHIGDSLTIGVSWPFEIRRRRERPVR